MAIRRSTLAEIGGFEALADFCADDYELGRRIAARGYEIVLAESTAATESAARDAAGFFLHQLRWAITLRHSRPLGYVGKTVFAQGLPWTLAALVVAPSATVAAGYALSYLILRFAMAWTAAGILGDGIARRKLYLLPVADAVGCAVSIAGLCSNRINWRGRWFELRKGRLVPIDASQASPTAHEVQS
jgi:ceramide glucosyltransferase